MSGILLNIGCGAVAPEGWMNIDASPVLRAARIPILGRLVRLDPAHISPRAVPRDFVAGPPFPPRSCDLIFASHVLEHLPLADARTFLQHAFTALAPGGILRVIVPDLGKYVEKYVDDFLAGEEAEGSGEFMRVSGLGAARSRCGLKARLREALSNARHQWMWSAASLRAELSVYPLQITRRFGHTDIGDARFAAVEQEKRHANAVCLEATK